MAELGEERRGARIELDSRPERQRKSKVCGSRQCNLSRRDRKRQRRQCAVNSVIRNALLGGMADRGNALAAALGLDEILLKVGQCVQLRRLLREHERNGDQQVA